MKGGVVGKTITLAIVLCVAVAAVCITAGLWWITLILMLPVIAVVFYSIKRCLDFAESNPQAAIMEGSELLVHEQLVHGQKGVETIQDFAPTNDHVPPAIEEREVQEEDLPPTGELPGPSDDNDKEGQ